MLCPSRRRIADLDWPQDQRAARLDGWAPVYWLRDAGWRFFNQDGSTILSLPATTCASHLGRDSVDIPAVKTTPGFLFRAENDSVRRMQTILI
ncbi:hypothetical protein VTJ04DRAFT_1827 [Mycothermus thermophilus]|uniref:uncharacterized protein n=1 Tax=Humicola insolens TaxID=85995 RepID=UPI00374245D2